MTGFFQALGEFLGLQPDAAAQVLISFLSAVIALTATVAAWMATRIAATASSNSREAHLVEHRPVFDIQLSANKLNCRSGAGRILALYAGEPVEDPEKETSIVLELKNVGNGSAVNFSYELEHPADHDNSIYCDTEVKAIFERGGFRVNLADDTLSIISRLGGVSLKETTTSAFSGTDLLSCEPGTTVSIDLGHCLSDEIRKFAIQCLRLDTPGNRPPIFQSHFLLKLYFGSILGERQFLPLRISLQKGLMWTFPDKMARTAPPSDEWSTMDIGVHISVARLEPLRKWFGIKIPSLRTYFGAYKDLPPPEKPNSRYLLR